MPLPLYFPSRMLGVGACPVPPAAHSTIPALLPPCHRHSRARGQWDAGAWLVTTAGGPGFEGGWSRSLAHVHLHLRHLQSSVPAGMSEGGRGRVDRSTHGTHSQGRPGRRCVTLREALHQGHVTVSQCHQTCHPPQCHQTWPLSQPWGPFALCPPIAITATQPCQDAL